MCRRIVLLAVVVLAMMGSIVAPARAQSELDPALAKAQVAAAFDQAFALAAQREYNALYESLHPDVRALLPRGAALGFFRDIYSAVQAHQAQIVGITFQDWTWPETGVTYSDAAVVTYVVPVLQQDGSTAWVEDTATFVRVGASWSWILGNSPGFIQSVIQTYGGEAPPPVEEVGFIESVIYDLDGFFGESVGHTAFTYESPGVMIVSAGTQTMSACGKAQPGFLGFYCPLDSTIYLDEPFLLDLVAQGYDFAAAFVIAHEFAHHVQVGIGFDRTTRPDAWNELHSIELELMADCFAGAWARDLESRGLLEPGDLDEALELIVYKLGDPKWVEEYDPQSHGYGVQRERAFLNGYEMGFLGCNILI